MQENNGGFLEEWAETLIFSGLAIACLVIYGQTVRFDFINLDDPWYVYMNDAVLSGINAESIKWAFTTFHAANWHPLTTLSHALDVQLFGLNAGAHHAVNVILHLANSCLVFIVFRMYTRAVWKSALIAILFAIHPAHVESVAWISERKDLLSTLFWLLTMLAYFRYATSDAAEGALPKRFLSPRLILTFAFLALGLLAKPMLVTLPFVLLLLDLWPLKRAKNTKSFIPLVVEKIPLFALAAASSVITYMAQKATGSVITLELLPIEGRILNALTSYLKYIVTLFYPVNLGVWYPFEPDFAAGTITASVVVLLAITAAAVWQIKERPYIGVGWFWFVGTLVPVIGLVQVGSQSMADRYTYVPYLGLFIIVVWGAAELVDRFEIDMRVVAVISSIAIAALCFAAFNQARYWKNSETLYVRTLAVTKENFFLMNLLCRHYVDRTPAENAERRCTELVGNTPDRMEPHNVIGILRVELGRYDDALLSFQKALEISPDTASVYANMSVAYSRKGDTEQAEKHLQRAEQLGDKSLTRELLAHAYNALGEAYAAKNETEKAGSLFQTAIRHDPKLEMAKENLAKLKGESK